MSESNTVTLLTQEAQKSLVIQRRFLQILAADPTRETRVDNVLRTLSVMFHYLCDRGSAVLVLVENGLAWDAEIVLRTYYECAAKILFIALNPPSDQLAIVEEYWISLGEVADHKRARKAGFARDLFSRDDQHNRDVFDLLQQPHMIRNALTLTKADRQRLAARG